MILRSIISRTASLGVRERALLQVSQRRIPNVSTGRCLQHLQQVRLPLANSFSTSTVHHNQAQKQCSSCGTTLPLNTLSCTSCSTLQPLPSELNAYELLGLQDDQIANNGWDVDLNELKSIWRKRMALSHPDRMGTKSEKEQQIAAQQSAMINKAYETLREPLQRAHLLLEKFQSSIPSEAESLEDPEVLMEVMELREELEEASTEEEAAQVRARNKERLDATVNLLREAFSQQPPDTETARSAAVGLRYWNNIEKAAREWQPGKRVELQH
ncbi:Co-chaperone Hsc20 [Meira miltonrushii]|uniref:Co-chaperone Hsc20 n=1 Tax=Meira miltonrushii TaxID=1280837 RepID=A0A316VG01_9BASI|nr:Co-chaperone Hsc20 [Meira miltonrushii]PWN35243.1 Co-chaperone Hsc20 [Meira miltonrushii]